MFPPSPTSTPILLDLTMPQTSTLPHIIIIGAGISGLAAAKTLFPYRCRLTVLEARDRIGGRAYTNHSHGIPIDCGASWIHGFSDENPLTAVAKRGGLRTYTGGESLSFNKRGGEPMPDEYAEELNGELFDLLYAARTYVKKNWHTIPLTMSFEDFIEMYLKDLEKKDPASWTREKIADLRSLSLYFEGYDATENVKQSLKYLDTEIRFEGENCFLPDGYDMLTRTYAEDVIKSNMIKLGEIVKRIEYNGNNFLFLHSIVCFFFFFSLKQDLFPLLYFLALSLLFFFFFVLAFFFLSFFFFFETRLYYHLYNIY